MALSRDRRLIVSLIALDLEATNPSLARRISSGKNEYARAARG
jgi:hypothetical protein